MAYFICFVLHVVYKENGPTVMYSHSEAFLRSNWNTTKQDHFCCVYANI